MSPTPNEPDADYLTAPALEEFLSLVERRAVEAAVRRRDSGEPMVSPDGRERLGVEAVLYLPAERLPAATGEEVALAPEGHGPLEDWCIEILGRLICFRDPTSARD